MPQKPKRTCKKAGCPNTHRNNNGYCDTHQLPRQREDNRPNAYQRGYDKRWFDFSRRFLKKHPTCRWCGAPADTTDHIIPFPIMKEMYGGNTYKEEHYQPLCKKCNDIKGKTEDKRMIEEFFNTKNQSDKNHTPKV